MPNLSNIVDDGTTYVTANISQAKVNKVYQQLKANMANSMGASAGGTGGAWYGISGSGGGNGSYLAYPGSYIASYSNVKAPQMMTMWDSLHEKILRIMETARVQMAQRNYNNQYSGASMNPNGVWTGWQAAPQASAVSASMNYNQAGLSSIAYSGAQQILNGQLTATQANTGAMMGGLTTTASTPTPGSVKRAMNALNRVLGSSQN